MAEFKEATTCRAPAIEVWKLLHDPVRFVEWWAGISRAEVTADGVLLYPETQPGAGIPTRLTAAQDGRDMIIDCLLTDDVYAWTLEPIPEGCRIIVHVVAEEERLRARHEEVLASLPRLVAAAEAAERT